MIIQRRGSELLFITQAAHAGLAAEIMAEWQPGGLPDHPRRAEILTATRCHDEGWQEEDAHLHVGADGAPLDFIAVPAGVKQRIWPRAADRLARASPYVAALVAEHALTIHAPLRGDPAWAAFFREMESVRSAQLGRSLPHAEAALAGDYPFVRTGDQLSLVLCNAWTAPASGPGYRAILKGITLEITPDPFGGRRLSLRVEARTLPVRSYASTADLRQAYAAAPVLMLEGEALGA
jgi:hypothetical protein